ncbi:hypothetical protein X801_05893, partial [Opisthorchis viverrini]
MIPKLMSIKDCLKLSERTMHLKFGLVDIDEKTHHVIEHCKANGRNVYPLERVARAHSLLRPDLSPPGGGTGEDLGESSNNTGKTNGQRVQQQ